MEMTPKEHAIALHQKGYNCAQAVVCAYCDRLGLPEDTAYRLSEGFGFGMGMMEVCGALSGAFLLAGWQESAGMEQPGKTKGATYKTNKLLANAFREKNGAILCRELKGVQTGQPLRSCQGCIEDACDLVETYLLRDAGASQQK